MSEIERGCLLIADISGYSRYLGGVELDHAQDILADLLSDIVANTESLSLAKLEGDAVFCHAPEGVLDGAALIDTIESCYFAFCKRRRNIKQLTTCPCDACERMEDLDLKFVAHHGEYVKHSVAGREELVGPDVIRVHRLLKNAVPEQVGTRGYAVLTEALVDEMDLGAFAAALPKLVEVADGEDVVINVYDLVARWEDQERQTLVVDEPFIDVSAVVQASPSDVWRIMSSPHERPNWIRYSTGVTQENDRGIPGVGTVNHCAHGDAPDTTDEIVDWTPFDHYSFRTTTPVGAMLVTYSVERVDDHTTRIRHRYGAYPGEPVLSDEFVARVGPVFDESVHALADLITERLTAR